MYTGYNFNKDECEDIINIIREAGSIWSKNLPLYLSTIINEEIEEIIEKEFDGDDVNGYIFCETVDDLIIPAIKIVYSDQIDSKLKDLLCKFVLDINKKETLYTTLLDSIKNDERIKRLKKSYCTEKEAIENGIENPFEYSCWECGVKFYAEWRSDYSPAAICPICGTSNR